MRKNKNGNLLGGCNHPKSAGRREWANNRDYASFSTYVECKGCGETLWDECYGPRGGY